MADETVKSEALKADVNAFFDNMQKALSINPKAEVGQTTVRLLRDLVTRAKEAGGDAAQCDKLIAALRVRSTEKVTATDAMMVAGQLQRIVQSGLRYGKD